MSGGLHGWERKGRKEERERNEEIERRRREERKNGTDLERGRMENRRNFKERGGGFPRKVVRERVERVGGNERSKMREG